MKRFNEIKSMAVGLAAILSGTVAYAALVTDGLVMHVHSQDVRVWSKNGKVARMVDQSTSKMDLPSAVANDGPTIVPKALNGHDILRFNGTSTGLQMAAADAGHLNGSPAGFTMFVVFRSSGHTGSTPSPLIRKGESMSSIRNEGYYLTQDGTYLVHRASDDGSKGQAYRKQTTSTDWVVFGMVMDPTTGTMLSLYNGEGLSKWFKDQGSLDEPFTASSRFSVGWNANAAGMDLAELVVYDRALNTAEWNEVGATLGQKYDIKTTYVIP